MSPLTVALLTFAVAFIAGAIFGKAFFATKVEAGDMVDRDQHHALLRAQRSRYRKRVSALHNLVRRHEAKQAQIRQTLLRYRQAMATRGEPNPEAELRIEKLQNELTTAQQHANALEKERDEFASRLASVEQQLETESTGLADANLELNKLRNERKELTARIQRLEKEQRESAEAMVHNTAEEAHIELESMRKKLASREQKIHELDERLRSSRSELEQLHARMEKMRQRVSPLTQKLRQQRQLLRQLRQASARKLDKTRVHDDLKEIRGIGPALERKLRSHGIEQFAQIAAMSEEELADVSAQLSIAPNMGRRQGWIQQARQLHRNLHGSG